MSSIKVFAQKILNLYKDKGRATRQLCNRTLHVKSNNTIGFENGHYGHKIKHKSCNENGAAKRNIFDDDIHVSSKTTYESLIKLTKKVLVTWDLILGSQHARLFQPIWE